MKLMKEIKSCNLCQDVLPFAPKPILQLHSDSALLLVGQAPGVKAHESGTPWNDASGERLRQWLQLAPESFYDSKLMSIVPMGFCYPGKGKSGDLPPRKECSVRWMDTIISHLGNLEVIILVGSYATEYFLGEGELSRKIKDHAVSETPFIVLPHPSPRNNIWLKKNAWFEEESLPKIRKKLSSCLQNKAVLRQV